MIVLENPAPTLKEFEDLMIKTNKLLNEDAKKRPSYYVTRGGLLLEDDVKEALDVCSRKTAFENSIVKVSGYKFPDIIAGKFYGVEVKSTSGNHWTSTGGSILETTRVPDVKRIYMMFGKLGGTPIEFLAKPYEECLCGIAVTHMPRYLIDMCLKKGESIFEKIGITYDELRLLDNPIEPVSKYYRNNLKKGESLWWVNNAETETVSATIRMWKNLSIDEKRYFTVCGCINYPEIFQGDYDRYILWLASQGIVDSHIRDQFSAGGQVLMRMPEGNEVKFPGVYRRIVDNKMLFLQLMSKSCNITDVPDVILPSSILGKHILNWCKEVSKNSKTDFNLSMKALTALFFGNRIL